MQGENWTGWVRTLGQGARGGEKMGQDKRDQALEKRTEESMPTTNTLPMDAKIPKSYHSSAVSEYL